LDLHQLRYFVALAEELNYRLAAERLRISKPTLSQQVRVLERSLGHRLLERNTRGVALTPAGEALLGHAREVLAAADRLRLAVSTATYGSPSLEVRVVNGVQHVLGDRLRSLQDEIELTINLTITSAVDAEEAVVSGRADAAVGWLPSGHHSTLHTELVGSSAVSLAVPEAHPLVERDVIQVAELEDEAIALFPRALAPALWDLFVGHLLPLGGRAGQVLEESTTLIPMMGMLRGASEGRGVAPFVHDVGLALTVPGVVLRPLNPPLALPIMVMCREPSRPEVRRLMTLLTVCHADGGSPSPLP